MVPHKQESTSIHYIRVLNTDIKTRQRFVRKENLQWLVLRGENKEHSGREVTTACIYLASAKGFAKSFCICYLI